MATYSVDDAHASLFKHNLLECLQQRTINFQNRVFLKRKAYKYGQIIKKIHLHLDSDNEQFKQGWWLFGSYDRVIDPSTGVIEALAYIGKEIPYEKDCDFSRFVCMIDSKQSTMASFEVIWFDIYGLNIKMKDIETKSGTAYDKIFKEIYQQLLVQKLDKDDEGDEGDASDNDDSSEKKGKEDVSLISHKKSKIVEEDASPIPLKRSKILEDEDLLSLQTKCQMLEEECKKKERVISDYQKLIDLMQGKNTPFMLPKKTKNKCLFEGCEKPVRQKWCGDHKPKNKKSNK